MGLACGIFVLCFTSLSSSVVPPSLSSPLYLGLVFRSTFLPSLHLSFISSSGWWGLSLSPPEHYFPCEDGLRLYLSWPSPLWPNFQRSINSLAFISTITTTEVLDCWKRAESGVSIVNKLQAPGCRLTTKPRAGGICNRLDNP